MAARGELVTQVVALIAGYVKTMRTRTVTALAPLRGAGRRVTPSIQAPWTTSAAQLQSRGGATLVDTPTAAHDLAAPPEAIEPSRKADAKKIFRDAVAATAPRNTWTRQEISAIYYQPLLELAHQAVSRIH